MAPKRFLVRTEMEVELPESASPELAQDVVAEAIGPGALGWSEAGIVATGSFNCEVVPVTAPAEAL